MKTFQEFIFEEHAREGDFQSSIVQDYTGFSELDGGKEPMITADLPKKKIKKFKKLKRRH